MELRNLIVDSKAAWVAYPGCDGFEVQVVNLARKEIIALRKRCTDKVLDKKTRQMQEELDEEKFIKEFTRATIKNWRGLKLKYLEDFILVDLKGENVEALLPYSQENAELLVSSSSEFDTWLNETVFDLENFRGSGTGGNVEPSGKVAQ